MNRGECDKDSRVGKERNVLTETFLSTDACLCVCRVTDGGGKKAGHRRMKILVSRWRTLEPTGSERWSLLTSVGLRRLTQFTSSHRCTNPLTNTYFTTHCRLSRCCCMQYALIWDTQTPWTLTPLLIDLLHNGLWLRLPKKQAGLYTSRYVRLHLTYYVLNSITAVRGLEHTSVNKHL